MSYTTRNFLRAQSLIEYTILIALVAGGIIAMHLYVFRGARAGIQSWQEQVNTSVGERIVSVGGGGVSEFAGFAGFEFLRGPYPNPFDDVTSFNVKMADGQRVAIRVRQVSGRNDEWFGVTNNNGTLTFYLPGGFPTTLWSGGLIQHHIDGLCFILTYNTSGLTSGNYEFSFSTDGGSSWIKTVPGTLEK